MMARITGLFVIAPFFGSMNIPVYFRAALALTFSIVMFPVVSSIGYATAPDDVFRYGAAVLSEVFVGWMIGFVAYVVFSAVNFAGKVMDMQVGFAMVNIMDPTSGQQIPLIGSFLYNLMIIVFIVLNGHHMLISALFESFRTVPILTPVPDPNAALFVSNLVYGVFVTGMKIAMPVTFAILLTNVGLGVLARTMPQLNIFVVGIPLQIIVGMVVLSILLPFYVMFLDVLFNETYEQINMAIRYLR
ncbi:flagellar biosynthetic protein FliR [Selenomonas sp. TAMA-11512]|uniref:flagellar biosynthetic protein FliR n=1 Tax=Selenomonas sp. TAMA-11512 TaxID=3095337 RepID=UPI0030D2BE98